MMNITVAQAQKLSSPAPFGLLSVRKEDGSTNLMAVSWWTYLSNHPPMLGVCLSKKGLSHSRIEAEGEFALSLVGEDLKKSALSCGTCSGKMRNKAMEFGIELEPAEAVRCQAVKNSRVIFECRLKDSIDAGDHRFYLAEILCVRGDENIRHLFAYNGYSELNTVN